MFRHSWLASKIITVMVQMQVTMKMKLMKQTKKLLPDLQENNEDVGIELLQMQEDLHLQGMEMEEEVLVMMMGEILEE